MPREAPLSRAKDGHVKSTAVAIDAGGTVSRQIELYRLALSGLAGRDGIRDDISKYEAIALTLVNVDDGSVGQVYPGYPPTDSPLHADDFMPAIYRQYDLRFIYRAPSLARQTERVGWDPDSPAIAEWQATEYAPRLQDDE